MEPDLMARLLRACISTQTITYRQLIAKPELTWYSFFLVNR
jgi:hypothetical protein